jgi:hypothetical protein
MAKIIKVRKLGFCPLINKNCLGPKCEWWTSWISKGEPPGTKLEDKGCCAMVKLLFQLNDWKIKTAGV